MDLQCVMKSKNKYKHSITAVAADALGNEITSAIMATDTVLIAAKTTPMNSTRTLFIKKFLLYAFLLIFYD